MSEVKPVHRYKAQTLFSFGGAKIEYFPHGPEVVLATEFDAQRLRADTAEAELQALRDKLELSERDRMAAERRYEEMAAARDCIATNYNQLSYGASICKEKLAAAEQRIAAMAELLKYVRTKPGFFSGEFVLKIDAALNPNPEAESHE